MTEERLKIAVFVDFDNIEIGVKKTLSRRFDIGAVLEAVKERGEVVTKIAYGDWKQNEDYSRAMTQHAIHMVQRNPTPGGDKNGADINLALDALEMAFTRDHINTFVIVGGDSDFIALVEKLKQYDKKVFVVGGRGFTSVILQKNCHEFISYENLVGAQSGTRRSSDRSPTEGRTRLENALPLLRRALKILSDREVSPQLGLLKSTLLQLDPTFSERDYGTSTFREFAQKLAKAGFVTLKQQDRSLFVELKDSETPQSSQQREPAPEPAAPRPNGQESALAGDLEKIFQSETVAPRWPMYLRNVKQYLKSVDPAFDERKYGFAGIHDLVRQAQKDGLVRVERNRRGIMRIFPGERLRAAPAAESSAPASEPVEDAAAPPVPETSEAVVEAASEPSAETVEATPESVPEEAPTKTKRRRASSGTSAKAKTTRRRKTAVKKVPHSS